MSSTIEPSVCVQDASTTRANPVRDVMSSGRRIASRLTPEEQAELRRIVHEAAPPTEGLRTLLAVCRRELFDGLSATA